MIYKLPRLVLFATISLIYIHMDIGLMMSSSKMSRTYNLKGGDLVKEHVVVTIDGTEYLAEPGQNVRALLNTAATTMPQGCYDASLVPIQSCDSCVVEVDGQIVRACGTTLETAMRVNSQSVDVHGAQTESLD